MIYGLAYHFAIKVLFIFLTVLRDNNLQSVLPVPLSRLRAITNPAINTIYKSSDYSGGDWYYDAADHTSADNTGIVIVTVNGKRLKRKYTGAANIEWFGAKANDEKFDNAPVVVKALGVCKSIFLPASKNYTILSTIQVSNLAGRLISGQKSTIVNRNYDAHTFLFITCNGIKIDGGKYTRDVLPQTQNGKNQSTIGFQSCKNVTVSHVHIDRSPEMGIDNNVVIGGIYTYNTIEHCLRDGIYAHYSANLKYIGNTLNQIKDDALSMHDYGIDAPKTMLHQAGYKQAGHSVISSNHISNAVQGISSIGCQDILISNNTIRNTVNAGICLFNSEDLLPGSTARVSNIKVADNVLTNNGFGLTVNGLSVANGAQISSGRAAIFIGCERQGQSYTTSNMRSASITVQGNKVLNSAVNGITLYNIDGITLNNNTFINCHSNTTNAPEYTGNIVEVQNCTGINVFNNVVTDTRPTVLHDRAYSIENSTGKFIKGTATGFRVEVVQQKNSRLLN